MLRAILGVVGGYVVMGVVVMAGLLAVAFSLGVDGMFAPGSYRPSATWLAWNVTIGIVAALLGGVVAALIAERGSRAPLVLAAIALVLGLAMGAVTMLRSAENPGPRPPDESLQLAAQKAQQPLWVGFVNPVIGAAGVLLGARLTGRSHPGPRPA